MKIINFMVAIPLVIFAFFHPPVGDKGKIQEANAVIQKTKYIKQFDEMQYLNAVRAFDNKVKVIENNHVVVKPNIRPKPKGSKPKHHIVHTLGVVHTGKYKCWRGCIAPTLPCAIPQYICNRESRFIDVQNPTSSACGKYQFVNGTWNHFMGYANACLAPEAVQDQKASLIWNNGKGASHWRCC